LGGVKYGESPKKKEGEEFLIFGPGRTGRGKRDDSNRGRNGGSKRHPDLPLEAEKSGANRNVRRDFHQTE